MAGINPVQGEVVLADVETRKARAQKRIAANDKAVENNEAAFKSTGANPPSAEDTFTTRNAKGEVRVMTRGVSPHEAFDLQKQKYKKIEANQLGQIEHARPTMTLYLETRRELAKRGMTQQAKDLDAAARAIITEDFGTYDAEKFGRSSLEGSKLVSEELKDTPALLELKKKIYHGKRTLLGKSATGGGGAGTGGGDGSGKLRELIGLPKNISLEPPAMSPELARFDPLNGAL